MDPRVALLAEARGAVRDVLAFLTVEGDLPPPLPLAGVLPSLPGPGLLVSGV